MALLDDGRRRESQCPPGAWSKASCSMGSHRPDPQGPCGPGTGCSAAPPGGEDAHSLEGPHLTLLVLLWELMRIPVSHGGVSASPRFLPAFSPLPLPLSSPFSFPFQLKPFLLHDRIFFFNLFIYGCVGSSLLHTGFL